MDGESVNVLVFLQPDSKQPSLLGMNTILPLGITVLRCSGEPVLANATPEPTPESQVHPSQFGGVCSYSRSDNTLPKGSC